MLTNSNNFIQTFEIHVKNIEKKPKKYRNKKDTKFKERNLSNAKKNTNMQEYISRNPDSSVLTKVGKILEISLEISLAIPFQNVLFFDLFCRSFNFMKMCIASIREPSQITFAFRGE